MKNQSTYLTPNELLLRQIAVGLSEAKAVRGIQPEDPAIQAFGHSLKLAVRRSNLQDVTNHTLGDLLATGEASIIEQISATGQRVTLNSAQWRRLLKIIDPSTIGDLLRRGHLHSDGMTAHVLSKTSPDNSSWFELLLLATELSTTPDTTLLSPHLRGLVSHPRIVRYAADYLRAQVAKFPRRYSEIARCHLSQYHLYRPFLIQQAGLPESTLTSNPPWPNCPARALFHKLQTSGHARIELMRLAPSLEKAIQNHKNIHSFLHARMRI